MARSRDEPWEPPRVARRVPGAVLGAAVAVSVVVGVMAYASRNGGNPEPTLTVSEAPAVAQTVSPAPSAAGSPSTGGPAQVVVPDVTGLTVRQARHALLSVGLRAQLDRSGSGATERTAVVAHAPPEGSRVEHGSVVGLRTASAGVERRDTPCGTVKVARRQYGDVIVGESVEVRTPDAAQLLVMDLTDPVNDLRVVARRLRGPGRLRLDNGGTPTTRVRLSADSHRMAEGWPPHWGVGMDVSGPGCWQLVVTGNGNEERLPFPVSRRVWRRHWQ